MKFSVGDRVKVDPKFKGKTAWTLSRVDLYTVVETRGNLVRLDCSNIFYAADRFFLVTPINKASAVETLPAVDVKFVVMDEALSNVVDKVASIGDAERSIHSKLLLFPKKKYVVLSVQATYETGELVMKRSEPSAE